jgi:hypothetical protein
MSDLIQESFAKSGGGRRPDFFIVGAPKCGTTALCRYLARNPEIYMCPLKEPHFFGADITTSVSVQDEEEYLALFAGVQDQKRVGESSVWYLYSKRAAAEIKEFSPAASIIVMLRNPVDVMHALHSQLLYIGREEIEDFETALDAESDRKRGLRIPRAATLKDHFFYRECVAYTEQIRRYVDVFGRENVRILIFDDFIADTPLVYRDTCKFLGVTAPADIRFEVVNANKRVRSKRLRALVDDPPLTLRKLGKPFTTRGLRHSALNRLRQLNTKYEPRRPMTPELRRRLQAEALPEVERLSNFLGRDLTSWCLS